MSSKYFSKTFLQICDNHELIQIIISDTHDFIREYVNKIFSKYDIDIRLSHSGLYINFYDIENDNYKLGNTSFHPTDDHIILEEVSPGRIGKCRLIMIIDDDKLKAIYNPSCHIDDTDEEMCDFLQITNIIIDHIYKIYIDPSNVYSHFGGYKMRYMKYNKKNDVLLNIFSEILH